MEAFPTGQWPILTEDLRLCYEYQVYIKLFSISKQKQHSVMLEKANRRTKLAVVYVLSYRREQNGKPIILGIDCVSPSIRQRERTALYILNREDRSHRGDESVAGPEMQVSGPPDTAAGSETVLSPRMSAAQGPM